MTKRQQANEKRTIDALVDLCMAMYWPKGIDAATTCVLLSMFRTAAEMSPRRENGTIDRATAKKILKRALRSLDNSLV